MVATEDLKKDHFMQGLHKDLAKDLKVVGVRDASFNELIDRVVVIKQADEEKKEEKRRNKGSVDQGNLVEQQRSNNNKRKGTPMVQYHSKRKCPNNHQKEVPRNVEQILEHVSMWKRTLHQGLPENGMPQGKANARVFTLTKTNTEGNP